MPGSIAVTTSEITHNILKYSVLWTSDAAGAVSGNTFDMAVGTIIAVEFIPSSGGTTPTTLYDVDMLDAENVTMFDDGAGTSIGTNLSATAASHKVPLVGTTGVTIYRRWHHGGPVQPTVAAAGDTKSGTINVYISMGVL
ncbi:MAG TPA: hypothetical protein VJQ57_13715 [Acidimicrobiia bacterium]|nr:hypothetical protein [Acidimicrobiia bacterium]